MRIFRPVNGETHTPFNQQVLGARNKYSKVTRNMLTPQLAVMTELRPEQAMPQKPPYPSSDLTPIFVCSATLSRGTEIPLQVHTVDDYP